MKHTNGFSILGCAVIAGFLCVFGAVPVVAQTVPNATVAEQGIRLNFRDAELDTVLDYLSEAAGFVIVRDIEISGTVNVWSHQTLSKDEAVNLLNTILNTKGYAAVRNGRTLTIMSREDAKQYSLPVRSGNNPEEIPPTDEMITQIIPVRYTDATKLIEDLRPLIPTYAVVSANESANAIVITDTQVSIRRMARIIQALDTSVSSISTLQVFILQYSDATETAKLVNDIFAVPSAGNGNNGNRGRNGGGFRGGFGGRGRSEGETGGTTGTSEARQAISRVLAVADSRTNAVVVSAPEELIPTIEEVIEKIDKLTEPLQDIQVFPLQFAAAEDMAKVINDSFTPDQSRNQNNRQGRGGPGARFFRGGGRGGGNQEATGASTMREYKVKAVADARTNSVIVTAESEIMPQIKRVVESLDANPARKQRVYVYDLQNADGQAMADMLNSMLDNGTTGGGSTNTRNTRTTPQGTQTTTGAGRGAGGGNQGGGGGRFN